MADQPVGNAGNGGEVDLRPNRNGNRRIPREDRLDNGALTFFSYLRDRALDKVGNARLESPSRILTLPEAIAIMLPVIINRTPIEEDPVRSYNTHIKGDGLMMHMFVGTVLMDPQEHASVRSHARRMFTKRGNGIRSLDAAYIMAVTAFLTTARTWIGRTNGEAVHQDGVRGGWMLMKTIDYLGFHPVARGTAFPVPPIMLGFENTRQALMRIIAEQVEADDADDETDDDEDDLVME